MPKKQVKVDQSILRERDYHRKIWEVGQHLLENGVTGADFDYVMQGGESVNYTAKKAQQQWCAEAMRRMEERLGREKTKEIRESSACCLSGARGDAAKQIFEQNDTVDARFAALQKTRVIVGGKAWKTEDGAYRVNFWGDCPRPEKGYTCGCLKYVPKDKPMEGAWCECCGGHIKHHVQTALGIPLHCALVASPLTSCGEKSCEFELTPVQE